MKLDLTTVRLGRGSHLPPANGPTGARDMCLMEAVALFAGEPWRDNPVCACPVLSAFLRKWNDALSDDDRDRLLPADVWVPRLIGTKAKQERPVEELRSYLALDWVIRTYTPAWLDLTPAFAEHAAALRSLPRLEAEADKGNQGPSHYPLITEIGEAVTQAAKEVKHKDQSFFWDNPITFSAAGAAAAAVWGRCSYRRALAGDSARQTSRSALWVALNADLDIAPTVEKLQQSALDLLDRMLVVEDA